MGTTSDKLTYLNTTKGKIKDVINMTGANITSDTTFRNYATKLYDGYISVLKDKNTLLDNMPKSTSTGYINEGLGLPIYEGKMSKESKQETTTGVQLANINDYSATKFGVNVSCINNEFILNGTVNSAGSLIGSPSSSGNLYMATLPAGTYTFSFKKISGSLTYSSGLSAFYIRNSSGQNLGSVSIFSVTENVKGIFTLTEETDVYLQYYVNTSNWKFANYDFQIMILSGDYTSSIIPNFEPYTGGQASPNSNYPQEIKTVKGNTNIFNPNQNFERGQYVNGTWESNNARVTTEFFPTKTGDKWNIFVDLDDSQNVELINYNLFDENYTWLGAKTENGDSVIAGKKIHSFQINIQNVAYMRISFRSSLGAYVELPISNVQNSKAQLTNGWEQMPYIPYGTNNYIKVNISNGTDSIEKYIFLNNNEICGIGTYKDELIVDKNGHCWLNKKTGKVVLNGSESSWSSAGGQAPFQLILNDLYRNNDEVVLISNYYKAVSYSSNWNAYQYLITCNSIANPTPSIRFKNADISSVDDFKTWLSAHNTEVYYVLATSQLIDLNYTVDLTLFEGVNNISNSEDMDMEIKFIKDTYE